MNETLRILSTLMTLGAHSPEHAVTRDDLAARMDLEKDEDLDSELDSLVSRNYVMSSVVKEGGRVLYLTKAGILAASTIYS